MFYDSETRNLIFDDEGNMVDAQGTVLVPSHVIDHWLPGVRRQHRPARYQGEPKPFQILKSVMRERGC